MWNFVQSTGEVFKYSDYDFHLDQTNAQIDYFRSATSPGMPMPKFLSNIRELLRLKRHRRQYIRNNSLPEQ